MSSGQMLLEREEVASSTPRPARANSEQASFADRWHRRDAISELVDELMATGRTQEAKLVGAILTHSDSVAAEDVAVRAFLTADWAEDWNSPEDSVYDQM